MSKSLGLLIAIIGVALSAVTFYYSRHDRVADVRPVLDVSDAQLVSRQSFGGNEYDNIEVTVINHGTHIASPTVVMEKDYGVAGDRDDMGRIAPGQSIKKSLSMMFDISKLKGQPGRFAIELNYSSLGEPEHSFTDEVLLCSDTTIGERPVHSLADLGSTLESNPPSAEPFPLHYMNPPEPLHRCGSLDDVPSQSN